MTVDSLHTANFTSISFYIGLHVDVGTLLTPIPDQSLDVMKLLHNHNEKVQNGYPLNPQCGILPLLHHQISPNILSEENSLMSLPPSLLRRDEAITKMWYDLIDCIMMSNNEEDENVSYPVRFQIMQRLFIPITGGGYGSTTNSRSSDNHIIVDVRDKTARFAILVPYEKVTEYTNTILTNDRTFHSLKQQTFHTTIQCREIDDTRFFVMNAKLKIFNQPQLQVFV